jgi:hypothetical protein
MLTGEVSNLPSGSPTPQITWNPTPGTFCISSDEEVSPDLDNCGDSDGDPTPELDGPGKLIPSTATQAVYTAASVIFVGPGTFVGNNCAQATENQPYVYVTASTLVNGVTLQASACIAVLP